MLSRVPPGDPQSAKHLVQVVECPVAVVPHRSDQHRRSSVCSVSSSVSSPVRATVADPVATSHISETQHTRTRDELPILRAQYVARGVRVLFGSRWRLNRFQERTIVLQTGVEPTLTVYAADSFDLKSPEATYVVALDIKCELISRGVNGIQLSSVAKAAGSPAFRLRIRFTTAADARIWCSIFQETLVHAQWSRDVRPVKQELTRTRGRNIRIVQHVHSLKRFVVKVLETNNEQGDSHELQVLRRLWTAQDTNVVREYRIVETPQEMLLIMPQLPGVTLLQFLRQRRRQKDHKLKDEEGWKLLSQLAALLHAVHQSGIVHCDLNLENILVSQDISRAWLIDFGGAYNLLDGHQDQQMTGTPGFIAPERVEDPLLPPTPKADVFSLGIVIFQALTGQHPYIDAIRDKRPLQLTDSLRLDWARAEKILTEQSLSPKLRRLVGSMLNADPKTRVSLDKVLAVSKYMYARK